MFNYSDFILIMGTISMLYKYLNFNILPDKIDNMEIFNEHKRFGRSTFWNCFWIEKHNPIRENEKVYIFCSKKNIFPFNFKPSKV